MSDLMNHDYMDTQLAVQEFLEGEKFADVAQILEETDMLAGSVWQNGVFMSIMKTATADRLVSSERRAIAAGKYYTVEFLLMTGEEDDKAEPIHIANWETENSEWRNKRQVPEDMAFLAGRVQCFAYQPTSYTELKQTITHFLDEFEPTSFVGMPLEEYYQ